MGLYLGLGVHGKWLEGGPIERDSSTPIESTALDSSSFFFFFFDSCLLSSVQAIRHVPKDYYCNLYIS